MKTTTSRLQNTKRKLLAALSLISLGCKAGGYCQNQYNDCLQSAIYQYSENPKGSFLLPQLNEQVASCQNNKTTCLNTEVIIPWTDGSALCSCPNNNGDYNYYMNYTLCTIAPNPNPGYFPEACALGSPNQCSSYGCIPTNNSIDQMNQYLSQLISCITLPSDTKNWSQTCQSCVTSAIKTYNSGGTPDIKGLCCNQTLLGDQTYACGNNQACKNAAVANYCPNGK